MWEGFWVWWKPLLVLLIIAEILSGFYLTRFSPVFLARTKVLVLQKPAREFVATTFSAEQTAQQIATTLKMLVSSPDFEKAVLNKLQRENPDLYPWKVLALLGENEFVKPMVTIGEGVISGLHPKSAPVVQIEAIADSPTGATALARTALEVLEQERANLYADNESLSFKVIQAPQGDEEPIFPRPLIFFGLPFAVLAVLSATTISLLVERKKRFR